jgi:hypothetical protein
VFEKLTPHSTKNKKACRDVVMAVPSGHHSAIFSKKIFEKFNGEKGIIAVRKGTCLPSVWRISLVFKKSVDD